MKNLHHSEKEPRAGLKPEDYDPISLDEFTEAARQVLLKPMEKPPPSENREPTTKERGQRYKLVRRDA